MGQDLRRLMGELDKLEAFAGGRRSRSRAEDVAAVLGRGLAQPALPAVATPSARAAGDAVLALLEELLDDGRAAAELLATLHRALRQVRGGAGAAARRACRASESLAAAAAAGCAFKVDGAAGGGARAGSDADLRTALRGARPRRPADQDRRRAAGGAGGGGGGGLRERPARRSRPAARPAR